MTYTVATKFGNLTIKFKKNRTKLVRWYGITVVLYYKFLNQLCSSSSAMTKSGLSETFTLTDRYEGFKS